MTSDENNDDGKTPEPAPRWQSPPPPKTGVLRAANQNATSSDDEPTDTPAKADVEQKAEELLSALQSLQEASKQAIEEGGQPDAEEESADVDLPAEPDAVSAESDGEGEVTKEAPVTEEELKQILAELVKAETPDQPEDVPLPVEEPETGPEGPGNQEVETVTAVVEEAPDEPASVEVRDAEEPAEEPAIELEISSASEVGDTPEEPAVEPELPTEPEEQDAPEESASEEVKDIEKPAEETEVAPETPDEQDSETAEVTSEDEPEAGEPEQPEEEVASASVVSQEEEVLAPASPIDKVVFIGTGNMGAPMAANLAKVVPNLWLYDADVSAAERAAEAARCKSAPTLAKALDGADCVILMLPNGDIVRRVLFDQSNFMPSLTQNLSRSAVVVDMSSSYVPTTLKTGSDLFLHGVVLCDAPVSGGVKRAVDASLTIMFGCDDPNVPGRVLSLLDSMGNVSRTGRLGSGHAMKALNNYLSAVGLTAATEAVLIGRKFGLDPAVMVDIINNSTGRNNATDVKFHQHILNGKFGSGFHLDLMAKDLRSATRMAEELEMNAPGLQREAELWQEASSAFEVGTDHTEIFKFIEARIDSEGDHSSVAGCALLCSASHR